jgi:hypothetical protein
VTHKPIRAFGWRALSPHEAVLSPQAAAVGPIEEDGLAFLLLLATNQNYVFKLDRKQLSELGAAISKALRDTTAEIR